MNDPIWIHVDVEATGPSPMVSDLLSIGAVAIVNLESEWHELASFYMRVDQPNPRWDMDTFEWWEQQNEVARNEAYADASLGRNAPFYAALEFERFVRDDVYVTVDDEQLDKVFVANPAGYDWQFINGLMWEQLGRNPLGYRSLCMRSMSFGQFPGRWGTDRTDWDEVHVEPEIPHHPLHDARAQALTFQKMMDLRG